MAAEVNADLELDKAIAAADCESVQPSIELVPLNSADKCNESPATIMTTVVDIESVETNYTQIKDVPSLTNIEAGASGSLTASLSKPSSPVAFHEPSAGGMNKKKYGKFRILLDDQQCSETGESGPASESECNSKTPPCQSPTSNAVPPVDSLSTSGKPDQFIPPTLLASNPKLFVNPSNDDDSEEDEEEETENDSTTVRRRGRPPKRRSRATRFTRIKRSNKKDATTPDTNPADESTAFRRRSSRLKSIDDKKDAELETNLPANPVEEPPDSDCVVNLNQTNPSKDDCEGITPIQIKTVTEEEAPTPISTVSVEIELKTSDHTSPLDSATVVETESKEKPKAKRGRKPKNAKVEKGAEKEKPREKRRYTRRKQIESAELDKNVSTAADPTSTDANVPNGFIEPLPLNESSSHDQTVQNCSKNGSDGDESPKPEKVKSRWRRNSELESVVNLPSSQESVLSNLENQANCNVPEAQLSTNPSPPIQFEMEISKENCPMPTFAKIDENIYLIEKKKTKFTKEAKKMVCDCILTKEERNRGIMGCGEDCLNRMLMIECGSRCPLGDHCSNKRFLKKQYSKVDPFKTAKKGWGLRAMQPLAAGAFIMEYVGEVLGPKDFRNRVKRYARDDREHHFFMALKADEIIDATTKGNITRFINHSCDPNAETQKWTVNGELRIGFFTSRNIQAGEEITFDYQFQRYGKVAQKCYCESYNCRGYIGANDADDVEIAIDGSKLPRNKTKEKEITDKATKEELEDVGLEDEIEKLKASGGLRNRQHCLKLARLMVRAEDTPNRMKLLEIMRDTQEMAYLRLMIDYHGLQLLWSWMVDLENIELKAEIIRILEILPIPNKTMLKDSRVLDVIEKWSKMDCKVDESVDKHSLENEEIEVKNVTDITAGDVEMKTEESSPNEKLDDNSKEDNEDLGKKLDDDLTSEEVVKSSGKQSREELSKFVIIKKEVHKDGDRLTNGPDSSGKASLPNIALMAIRLLNQWKDLREVYRIPRMERQKRHEDEKEADRKALENEERMSRGLMSYVANRANYKPPPSADDREQSSQLFAYKKNFKKKSHYQNGNYPGNYVNGYNSEGQSKVSKEEHRAYYNVELMRKDYEEAMKQYKKQMEQFNNAIQHQMQMGIVAPLPPPMPPAPPPSIFGMNQIADTTALHLPMPIQTVATSTTAQSFPPSAFNQTSPFQPPIYTPDTLPPNTYPPPKLPLNGHTFFDSYGKKEALFASLSAPTLTPIENRAEILATDSFTDSIMDQTDNSTDQVRVPTCVTSVLIECTSKEHSLVDDVRAVIQADYGVELVPSDSALRKRKYVNLFDCTYPAPGSYFVDEQRIYYVPCRFTSGTSHAYLASEDDYWPLERYQTTVIQNIPSFMFPSKEVPKDSVLPLNWFFARDRHGFVYYYNKFTRKVQWNFPTVEPLLEPASKLHEPDQTQLRPIESTAEDGAIIKNVVISSADSTSTPRLDAPELLATVSAALANPQLKALACTGQISPMIAPATAVEHPLHDNHLDADEQKRKALPAVVTQLLSSITNAPTDPNKTIALDPELNSLLTGEDLPNAATANGCEPVEYESIIRFNNPPVNPVAPFNRISERKQKEKFKAALSEHIKNCLNPYRRFDCKVGRILCNDDFKFLARKLTHIILLKEMKHCKSSDSLIVSDAVKHKSKDFVRKYMSKYGPFYRPEDKDDPEMCRDNSFSPNSDIATSRFQATYVPTIQSNESNEMRSDSAGQ